MQYTVKISDRVHWIGANDRKTHLFENIWPIPEGVAYNSYLINDQKTALLDTIDLGSGGEFMHNIMQILDGKTLDYMIINHMELDHASLINEVIAKYPQIKIIGNALTAKVLTGYFPEAMDNFMAIKNEDIIDLGYHKLQFYMTPGVHWPETMMTYDQTEKILFSGDAFGTFGCIRGGVLDSQTRLEFYEDEMRRYYSNIVGKFSGMVQKAIAKLANLPINTICSLHGPVWQESAGKVVDLYNKWSSHQAENGVVIYYASMYGNTEQMADYIAHKLAEEGVRDIVIRDVSRTHLSYLISDLWKYKGVILGSPAYNGNMFPVMETLCTELVHLAPKDKLLGLFGSYSWNGGGVRSLSKFAEQIGWTQVSEPCEMQGRATAEKYKLCDNMVKAMAEALK